MPQIEQDMENRFSQDQFLHNQLVGILLHGESSVTYFLSYMAFKLKPTEKTIIHSTARGNCIYWIEINFQ